MIGIILTISDLEGQGYVENAREAWSRQRFLIDSKNIEDVLSHDNLSEYYMIALTMNQELSALFRAYVKLSCFSRLRCTLLPSSYIHPFN